MTYANTTTGIFITRPNRFIAHVELDGETVVAHVKNTGRCKELLIPGARVFLYKSDKTERKTLYDLIAVWKGERLVNIDSQVPNMVFKEYMQSGKCIDGITLIKSEVKYSNSRFDLYVEAGERKIFIEVKGVTLEENGVAMFPDAPTERGVKHLNELVECVKNGYETWVVFVIQMKDVRYFTPNVKTHAVFGETLVAAERAGVKILAFDCEVTEDSLKIGKPVEVRL